MKILEISKEEIMEMIEHHFSEKTNKEKEEIFKRSEEFIKNNKIGFIEEYVRMSEYDGGKEYEKFRKWLVENNKDGKYNPSFYWHYDDRAPLENLEIKKGNNIEFDLGDHIFDINIDHYFNLIEEAEKEAMSDYKKETDIDIKKIIKDNSLDLDFEPIIDVDMEIPELMEKTEVRLMLFPNQEENCNTEGSSREDWYEELYNSLENDITSKIQTLEKEAPLEVKKLFKSQEYEIKDLFDSEKIKNSVFLKSFLEEINNRTSCSCDTFLTYCPKSNLLDVNKFLNEEGRKITINPVGYPKQIYSVEYQAEIGIYDPILGGGSLMDITLEKPITFTRDDLFSDEFCGDCLFNVLGTDVYGYNIEEVYGGLASNVPAVIK